MRGSRSTGHTSFGVVGQRLMNFSACVQIQARRKATSHPRSSTLRLTLSRHLPDQRTAHHPPWRQPAPHRFEGFHETSSLDRLLYDETLPWAPNRIGPSKSQVVDALSQQRQSKGRINKTRFISATCPVAASGAVRKPANATRVLRLTVPLPRLVAHIVHCGWSIVAGPGRGKATNPPSKSPCSIGLTSDRQKQMRLSLEGLP
jgi:hypothetical protein